MCKELQDLPFEITKYGKVISTVTKGSHLTKDKVVTTSDITIKGSHNTTKQDQPKKLSSDDYNKKTALHTGGGFFNPQPKNI